MNSKETQNNIENKVLQKISETHLKPKSKWEFLLKNIYFWILGSLTIVLGSLTVSASIFVFENSGWQYYQATHDNFLIFLIDFLPYVWIILFVIFALFSNYLITKTRHGYRYQIHFIVLIVLLISIILGFGLSKFGCGRFMETKLTPQIPFHRNVEMKNYLLWNKPEEGLLAGRVIMIDDKYMINDLQQNNWELILDDLNEIDRQILELSENVKIVGLIKDEKFYACKVMPFNSEAKRNLMRRNFEIERKIEAVRNNECEGLRPYRRLLE